MLGYLVTYEEHGKKNSSIIPEAYYIKRDTSVCLYDNDAAAVAAARHDGVCLIYGMDNVPDGIYLDTPQNRQHIITMLLEFPRYKKFGINFTAYAQGKLELLVEFEITLTPDEEQRLSELRSEISIDTFMRELFNKYL
jgi:hypothetical protein